MKTSKGFKSNSIVIESHKRAFTFYGRVWKVLDDEHVIVIDCGKHVTKYNQNDLDLVLDYKGRWVGNNHFSNMATLRHLKKGARDYNPDLEPEDYKKVEDV